jgi:murein L,D-transpeptidase YcbB/YkuD
MGFRERESKPFMGTSVLKNRWWAGVLLALLLMFSQRGMADDDPTADVPALADQVRECIARRIEGRAFQGELVCDNEPICAREFIPEFYRNRAYAPVWVDAHGVKPTARLLLQAIRQADREGLRASDYHLRSMETLLQMAEPTLLAPSTEQANLLGDFDILLTDAFLMFNVHLSKGRVNPETLHKDWLLASRDIDLNQVMASAESESRLEELFRAQRPNHRGYEGLQEALESMRRISASGGWPHVPGETSLRVGERDARVPALSRRLGVTGQLAAGYTSVDPNLYDAALEAAVKRFQGQHGLRTDGVVGRNTLRALNVTAEKRVRQIELNLERWRWLPRDLGRRFIVVNTAGFNLKLIENERTTLQMRVVVGRPARQTPVFSTPMSYLVLNPYWYVPRKIAVEDMLPQIRRQGANYLARQKIRLYNGWGQDAQELNPWTVNWAAYDKNHFPFRFRQEPGRSNSLGSIKFMMPNKFAVYLHDTPNRALFDLEKRDHSSGCIRVENAFDLAVAVLKNESNWPPEKIKQRLKNGRTQVVRLTEPLPVHLIYLTAWADEGNVLQFRDDIYDRDQSLDRALRKRDAAVSQAVLSTIHLPSETPGLLQ